MNYVALYDEFKLKKQLQQTLQQEQLHKIRSLSSTKKLNQYSSYLLNSKLLQQLSKYNDEDIINLESSIPILYEVGILQHLDSIESAKQKMESSNIEQTRMKWEARFIYCLWKMIDQEEIQTKELKEIIYNLQDKKSAQLKKALEETYKEYESVVQFMETWKTLKQDRQYYKTIDKRMHQTKEIQRISTEESHKRRVKKCDNTNIKTAFLRERDDDSNYKTNKSNYKTNQGKQTQIFTEDSAQKQNNDKQVLLDKAKQRQLVSRLYNNDKYKLREERKKQAEQHRMKEELDQCTFKPQLIDDKLKRSCSKTRSTSINGYSKAVNRMKVGQQKSKIQKHKRQYLPKGQNYQKLRQKTINPPKFLQRKKEEEVVLFLIEFDLGRHKIKIKVHENDTQDSIARNLCKIYCLKHEYYEQIKQIVRTQRLAFQLQKSMK